LNGYRRKVPRLLDEPVLSAVRCSTA